MLIEFTRLAELALSLEQTHSQILHDLLFEVQVRENKAIIVFGIFIELMSSLFIEKMPLVEKGIDHDEALVDGYYSYLRNVLNDLGQQEEVLVAQDRLEEFQLLNLGVVIDDLCILD